MAEVEITEENFEQEVLRSNLPVMVDFWAIWCGPCKILSPLLDEISRDYEGRIKIGKLNVDEHGQLTMRYNVMSIPTMKFFKQGKLVGEIVGAAPRKTIEEEIKRLLL